MGPETLVPAVAIVVGMGLATVAGASLARELASAPDPEALVAQGTSPGDGPVPGWLVRAATLLDHSRPRATEAVLAARDDAAMGPLVVNALRHAPTSPYHWSRLAALQWRDGRHDKAARAYALSIVFGRHAPNLAAPRAALGFALLSEGAVAEADVDGQIRLAAMTEPDRLAQLSQEPAFRSYIRATLSSSPDAAHSYDVALRREREAGLR
jgi:hypothetical protein